MHIKRKIFMIGAIIGDIAGSRFEFNNFKDKDFELFSRECFPTDDSVMTVAVGKAILECEGDYRGLAERAVACMQEIGRPFPHCGYGRSFKRWIYSDDPQPYNSFGNGAAMRVSAAGFAARSLEEAKEIAYKVTAVSHNHPEGVKGAVAVAAAIYLAREGRAKDEIKAYIADNYYNVDFTPDEIRPTYKFEVSCQGTVPPAFASFFASTGFEDTVRNAVSLGGDSDTLAAIAGSIAEAFYGVPQALREEAEGYLKTEEYRVLYEWLKRFEERFGGQ